ncbi:hypothetical protein scyTo_0022894, partial [Scyliorhinus torazame]|nr:hypothetical protein [Scyliorhinus torazame]
LVHSAKTGAELWRGVKIRYRTTSTQHKTSHILLGLSRCVKDRMILSCCLLGLSHAVTEGALD